MVQIICNLIPQSRCLAKHYQLGISEFNQSYASLSSPQKKSLCNVVWSELQIGQFSNT